MDLAQVGARQLHACVQLFPVTRGQGGPKLQITHNPRLRKSEHKPHFGQLTDTVFTSRVDVPDVRHFRPLLNLREKAKFSATTDHTLSLTCLKVVTVHPGLHPKAVICQ